MKQIKLIAFGTLALWMLAIWSHAQTLSPNSSKISTDGTVFSVAENDDYIVIGGNFTRVGGDTRFGAIADGTTGDVLATNPEPDGPVWVCIPDGSGGFYIGGEFTEIGGVGRAGLAQVNSAGAVTTWNPGITGTPRAMAMVGSTIYIGGFFTEVGGQSRDNIVAVTTTGTVTSWNPDIVGTVYTIAADANSVFVGGTIFSVGSDTRNKLAEISTSTGLATSWDPSPDGLVNSLVLSGDDLYVGGKFTTISSTARNYIAAYDMSTGSLSSWNPNASSDVNDMVLYGDELVVAGRFNAIGGSANAKLAVIDRATGLATSFDPDPFSLSVDDLAIDGDILYTAGNFYRTFSRPRLGGIAAYDLSTGTLLDWDPGVDHQKFVFDLTVSSGQVYVGGNFNVIGGTRRVRFAVLDKETLELENIDVEVTGFSLPEVKAVELISNAIIVGGDFDEVGGQSRNNLASISLSTGLVTSWNPSASGSPSSSEVNVITSDASSIYLGGNFSFVGGEARNHVAEIDIASGTTTSWNPNFGGAVNDLIIGEGSIYATGTFTTVGGQSRNRLAEVDATTGAATSWNPNLNDEGNALVVGADGNIYVGGEFTSVGAIARNRLTGIDPATGLATDWNMNTSGEVYDLFATQSLIYVGGDFSFAGGVSGTRSVGALDVLNEQGTSWDAQLSSQTDIRTIHISEDYVMLFGDFEEVLSTEINKNALLSRANDGPTDISLNSTSFNENVKNAFIGTLSAMDDAGDTHTYTLVSGDGDTDNATFTVSGSQLNFKGTANFEFKSSYSIRLQASDQNGLSLSKAFTITVTDQQDAPTDIVLTPDDIDENSGANELVGALAAEDEDASDTHVFAFTSGKGDDHNTIFSLIGKNLYLKEGVSHEKFEQLSVRLSVEDRGRNVFETSVLITINDLPESPTSLLLIDNNIDENEAIGTAVGSFTTNDQDEGDMHTYTLVSGTGDTDNASFTIDGGQLKSAEVFDFETKSTYSIRVQTDDGTSTPLVKVIQIDVDDVDEIGPALISSTPADNETDAAPPTTITLNFDEEVFFFDSETIIIALKRSDLPNAVQNWVITNGALPDFISVSGSQITLEVTSSIFFTLDYFLESFQVEDALGNTSSTPQIDFTIRAALTDNDVLGFSATGMDGLATIDAVNHTITANMLGSAPVFVDPQFTLSEGAVLFGSLPDQWATNENYWMSGETKTVNVQSESGSNQTWSVTLTWQALTGTYSVGETGYFRTLSSAIDELELRGIGADVTYELQDGYDEFGAFFIDLDPYPGNDLHTTTVTVEDGATSAHFYYNQIGMDGIQNFVVDGKGVLEVESVTNAFFDLDPDAGGNPCGNITLKNLIGFRDPNSTATAFGRLVSADAVDGLVIENNTLSYQEATVINVGVQSTNVEVSGNEIRTTDTNSVTAVIISSSGNTTVVNNTIYVTSPRGTALSVSNSDNAQIHHNTIYADFSASHQSNAGIYLGASTSTPQVSNNIIQMNGAVRQAGFYVRFILESEVNLSYNNIYMPFENSLENYAEFIEDNVKYGVNQWEAFLTNHPNHTNEEAFFTDAENGDLTLTGTSLASGALRGTPLGAIAEDINGDTRSTAGPSKGAYEYANIATDILALSVPDQGRSASIDVDAHTVEILLTEGSSTTQVPEITTNTGASINPATGVSQDFSSPVIYTVTAEEGNTQDWTVSATILDETAPVISSLSPVNNATGVLANISEIAVTFDEPVQSTGLSTDVVIRTVTGNVEAGRIDVADASVADFSGSTLTLTVPSELDELTTYYVTLPFGAIEDLSGNDFVGYSNNTIWRFTTEDFPFLEWNGSEWNNVTGPASNGSDDVVIAGNYSFEANGLLNVRNLTINSGATLNVDTEESLYIVEDLTNNGELIIGSGATLLVFESGTITGNDVKVQRNTRYADGRYSFVGSPVGQSANTTASDLGSFVYTYDESQSASTEDLARWIATGASDQLVSGKGYTQANQQLIEFVGVPNTGTVNYTGSYANDGWNLISNPYTASIEVSDFLGANNTTGAIYIWDDNGSNTGRGSNSDYIVANGTMATNTTPAGGQTRYNGYMGVAQGFFVKLMDNSNTNITFNEGMRAGNNNEDEHFFRKSSEVPSHVRINLTADDGLFKQAILAWMPDINDSEVDRSFDAAVFSRAADYAVYTLKVDQPLAIQGVTYDKEEIPLGFHATEAGTYQIEIDQSSFEGSMLYLIDKQTEETVDLTQGSYSFYTQAGQFTDRFIISTVSSILSTEVASSNIYTVNKELHIDISGSQPIQYELFNLSGKKVATMLTSGKTKVDLGHLPNGIYLVSDGVETKKIVLK